MNDFICHHVTSCSLVFQMHHTPVLSLHHAYCACIKFFHCRYCLCIKLFTTVLFLFQVLHHESLAFHFLASTLSSSLYWYPLFIVLQHIIIGIQATSGIISLDPFGMILIHLAWMAQRFGGSLALALFSSFTISGWGMMVYV